MQKMLRILEKEVFLENGKNKHFLNYKKFSIFNDLLFNFYFNQLNLNYNLLELLKKF